jgi:hypothetical protein
LAIKTLLCEPTVIRDPSFGFCLRIKLAEVTGGVLRPGHLHTPMTPLLDWLHYNARFLDHQFSSEESYLREPRPVWRNRGSPRERPGGLDSSGLPPSKSVIPGFRLGRCGRHHGADAALS